MAADDLDHTTHGTPGGLNVQIITVVGIVTVLLIVVAVFAVQAWYFRFEQAYTQETVYREVPAQVQRYREHEQRRLTEARLRVPEHDLAAIPIDAAMDLYLQRRLESNP
ncbi:MAG: hypothetical protein WD294_14185 [Phycisphaeraceae bacterium]